MKKTILKKSTLAKAIAAVFFLLSTGLLQAQSSIDWTLASQKNGINVSYKVVQCNDGSRILFQIQNTTTSEQMVNLTCKIMTGGVEILIPSLENTVHANSTLEGTCTDSAAQSTFILLSNSLVFSGIVITIN